MAAVSSVTPSPFALKFCEFVDISGRMCRHQIRHYLDIAEDLVTARVAIESSNTWRCNVIP